MTISTTLTRPGGVARTRQLRALGVSVDRLRLASDRGEICRVRKGVYEISASAPATIAALGIDLESQVEITGVGQIDIRHGFVLFEIDGKENHDSQSKRHKDLRRNAAAIRKGYQTVRFDYAMIIHDWSNVLETVIAVLNRSEISSGRRGLR